MHSTLSCAVISHAFHQSFSAQAYGMRMPTEHTISTQTHGRYLVSANPEPHAPLLIGFHGYGETAEEELARLRTIPGTDDWTLVSVQGLHQFYRRRTNEVVASWMTRQNRELAIQDNIAFVANVVRLISGKSSEGRTVVFSGFSQGVAMAFRAAAFLGVPVAGVIACGGDVPPELDAQQLQRIRTALLGRGSRDTWYTVEKLASDEHRLRTAGVSVRSAVLDAEHEWTPAFSEISGEVLQAMKR
jgi:predicted esterase